MPRCSSACRGITPRRLSGTALRVFDKTTTSPVQGSRRVSRAFRPTIAELLGSTQGIDNRITVNGHVRSVRKQKRVAFAAIEDGSTIEPLQAVLTPQQAQSLTTGSSVRISGVWQPSPADKEQSHELVASEVAILGSTDPQEYPLQKKFQTPEYLRTLPHLRARLPFNALLLRLRSQVIASATEFFSKEGFVQTHPPVITSSDCEGAGEVFTLLSEYDALAGGKDALKAGNTFFRKPKYLTVSAQLHLEALAQSVGKVWTLSPTFRAEKSDTPRHLSEFYMLEAEVAFLEDADELMDLVEGLLVHISRTVLSSKIGSELVTVRHLHDSGKEEAAASAEILQKRLKSMVAGKWPRITFEEAVNVLRNAETEGKVTFEFQPEFDKGLQAEHERFLAAHVGRDGPVFVTDYPQSMKPFYMGPASAAEDGDESRVTVPCFDLLVPGVCELVGGSIREHRLAPLLENMRRAGFALPPAISDDLSEGKNAKVTEFENASTTPADNALQWYVDLRKYGTVPHGGFGLGFDRLLSFLAGVPNIRDVVSFPRWHGRCDC